VRKQLSAVCAAVVAVAAAGFGAIVPAHASFVGVVDCNALKTDLATATSGDVYTLHDASGPCGNAPFTINTGAQVTIQGQTQAEGFDGTISSTGILTGVDNGATVITNLTFKNGSTANRGAAIGLSGSASPTVSNSIFLSNNATQAGGAINVQVSGDATLTGNTFGALGQPNTAAGFTGGAAFVNSQAHVNVSGNQFLYNSTTGSNSAGGGGGIAVFSESTDANAATFTNNILVGNTTDGNSGAGAFIESSGGQVITGNTFRANVINFPQQTQVDEKGAGLSIVLLAQSGGSTTVVQAHNLFDSNVIHGGVRVGTVARLPVAQFDFGGAGEFATAPSVLSTDDTYVGNHVDSSGNTGIPIGGGFALQGNSSGNATQKTTLTAANMVVANNSVGSSGEGGGVYAGFDTGCSQPPCTAEVDAFDSTVTANSVGAGGSGPEMAGNTTDTAKLVNSIVTGPVGSQTDVEGFGTFTATYSDVCNAGAAVSGTGNICKDPLLKNVAGNDVHQTSASPTFDTGNSALVPSGLTQDYEGDPRISGARVDIGADEIVVAVPTLPLSGQSSVLQGSVVLWLGGFGLLLLVLATGGLGLIRYRGRSGSVQ
jgi:parallel beta-helix repeat protein